MNKAILLGRLTKDPEVRTSANGVNVASFSLAVPRRFKKDEADFINVVCFRQTADFVQKYFTKGQQMAIVGSIQTRTWEGQDGKKNYATEVIADEVHFAGNKNSNAPTGNSPFGGVSPSDFSKSNSDDEFMPINDDDDSIPF